MTNFFFQAEDGIRDGTVTGVQTCALPICLQSIDNQAGQIVYGLQAKDFLVEDDGVEHPVRLDERSEERRVGKECRSRRSPSHEKQNENLERDRRLTPKCMH